MDQETQAELDALRLLAGKAERDGRYSAALNYYEDVLRILPEDFQTLVTLGDVCTSAGDRKDLGISFYSRALRVRPNCKETIRKRNALYRERVGAWHFRMMNDETRNQAFCRAIEQAVTSDSVVLDVGCGSGLLAMMAVRCGARHVYTIEGNGTIGDMAREIIANHGMSDRITVVSPYYSSDIRLGYELQERAHILTAELLGNDTLAEDILGVTSDARHRLLHPGARLIPNRVTVYGILVESAEAYKLGHVGSISGFDLRPFNRLFGERDYGDLINSYSHRLLSEPFEVFDFDLYQDGAQPEIKQLDVTTIADGTCHLILKWQRIYTNDETYIDTWHHEPSLECPAWLQKLHFCPEPLRVKQGQTMSVRAEHDMSRVFLSIAAPDEN